MKSFYIDLALCIAIAFFMTMLDGLFECGNPYQVFAWSLGALAIIVITYDFLEYQLMPEVKSKK